MSMVDKMWDAFTTVIKMNDKVVSTSERVAAHQAKLENLTERVIRLETALEIAMANTGSRTIEHKRPPKPKE